MPEDPELQKLRKGLEALKQGKADAVTSPSSTALAKVAKLKTIDQWDLKAWMVTDEDNKAWLKKFRPGDSSEEAFTEVNLDQWLKTEASSFFCATRYSLELRKSMCGSGDISQEWCTQRGG